MTRRRHARVEPAVLDVALEELLGADEQEARLDALASALAPPATVPSTSSRARLLASLKVTHRFDDLEATVAELLDLDAGAAGALLLAVDRPGSFTDGPGPGCTIFHVEGGPRVKDAVTGFVRLEPRCSFPHHEHLGDEIVLVLQGAFRDDDGTTHVAGQIARRPGGTAHAFAAEGELPLLYLAIVQRGVVIDGTPLLAGDPRA
ncbi:MAG: cupin domain-containing protein [Sandaracinaceae bacterium]|nr:cupin domain-containing protein [Sandaracinaceae bacterium]